jgi:ribosome-associated protein
MAKIPVKKKAVKKTAKSAAKKTAKKTVRSKSAPAKKTAAKKPVTDKEREFREANLLANLEKKKKPAAGKRPKKTASAKQTSSLLDAIIDGMQERKAKNITILNLREIENRVTDYFVICDAESNTHVNSIADSIEDTVARLTGEKAYHSEGRQNGEWILIDYINIVAHVFMRETREHYNVEGLWGDAEMTRLED